MSQKTQIVMFGVLVAILAGVVYSNVGGTTAIAVNLFTGPQYKPLNVPDPTLRFDLLREIQKQDYVPKRNIFVATVQQVRVERPVVEETGPPPPPPPPPAVVEVFPFKFYGYKEDPRTGKRRAFFTDGDNLWILNVGDTLQNRWKLLRIGNDSAEVESIASGKRHTAQLEQPPAQ